MSLESICLAQHLMLVEEALIGPLPFKSRCPRWVDIVEKVFLGRRTKILRAAHAFYARRREGPYRFIQNRSRTSVVELKSDAAAEKSKDQFSRDFWGRSIFDFCNNICQQQTPRCANEPPWPS